MADMGIMGCGNLDQANAGVGQRIQKQVGQTGIPVYNVANACATGATAFRTVYLAIKAGECDMGLAVGVEQMGKQGLLGAANRGRKDEKVFEPAGRYGGIMKPEGVLGTGLMPGVFAQAGMEYAYENDGVGFEQFAKVAEKNHAHSVLNPLAQYQKAFTLEEIMGAEMISYPNTLMMCCPTGDGAAAAVLVSGEKLKTLSKEQQRRAVKISPSDLDLVELHDCFATAELIHYDNLRLCEPGGAGEFIDKRGPWRDGETPVNVSGGLLSKGHPLGATGIANIYEVSTHLRGEAGDRQIDNAKVGMTHVIGLGSACSIHILERSGL
jgi:acetyl-CoA acyltransferase